MKYIRADGVPIIITIFAMLIGLFGFFMGVRALFDGSAAIGYIPGAEPLGVTWGGRNAALGLCLIVAVALRHAAGYSVAFLAGILREISDMMGGGFTAALIIFTLIEAVFFVICARAAWLNWKPLNSSADANRFWTVLDYVRPLWLAGLVTLFALLIGVVGTTLGVSAMLDPTTAIDYVAGADVLGLGWGGRNAALGVAMFLAVLVRHPAGYAVAISGSILREISDIMVADSSPVPLLIFMSVEVVFFVICLVAAVRAMGTAGESPVLSENPV